MVCIVMFLFSYVNNSMFWHGHSAQARSGLAAAATELLRAVGL